MRGSGIMAYGDEVDRQKLKVLAKSDLRSSSAWILEKIQSEYAKRYGNTDPQDLLPKND